MLVIFRAHLGSGLRGFKAMFYAGTNKYLQCIYSFVKYFISIHVHVYLSYV